MRGSLLGWESAILGCALPISETRRKRFPSVAVVPLHNKNGPLTFGWPSALMFSVCSRRHGTKRCAFRCHCSQIPPLVSFDIKGTAFVRVDGADSPSFSGRSQASSTFDGRWTPIDGICASKSCAYGHLSPRRSLLVPVCPKGAVLCQYRWHTVDVTTLNSWRRLSLTAKWSWVSAVHANKSCAFVVERHQRRGLRAVAAEGTALVRWRRLQTENMGAEGQPEVSLRSEFHFC